MEKTWDIVTALDTCVDLMMRGDVMPRFGQAEQLVDDYFLEMGGSACILACQCAKLGLRAAGVGAVGQDAFGSLVLERLRSAGVDTSHVRTESAVQTGLGLALCRPGDRAILTVPGSMACADPDQLLALLPQTRHLHVASYYLLSGLRPHWPPIFREAKRLGLTISLDTNWDPAERWDGLDELAPYVDILFPNDMELAAFTGISEVERAMLALTDKFPIVAAKLGAGGAVALQRGGSLIRCPALELEPVDTVGAGDSFGGGFLYGYLNNRMLKDCLRIGVFCGGRSVLQRGGWLGQPWLTDLQGANLVYNDSLEEERS